MRKIWKKLIMKSVIENERASMLVLSLLVAAVFVTFGAGYLGMLAVEAKNTERAHRSNVAMHIAEAGVEEGIWEVSYNSGSFSGWTGTGTTAPKIKTTSLATASGENLGTYTVTVTDSTSSTPVVEGVGQALYGASTLADSRTIQVELSVPESSTYQYAAFVESELTMEGTACTDSYDSTLGDYDEDANSGSNGNVGTNSTEDDKITLEGTATVEGKGVAGTPDDTISVGADAQITGGTETLESAYEIPSVSAPTGYTSYGDLSSTVSFSGNREYSNIQLAGSDVLTLSGDANIYVTNEFKFEEDSQLVIAAGAEVKIYVDGNIKFETSAGINNLSKDPSKLILYGTDSMVDTGADASIMIETGAEVHAVIHAKYAQLKLETSADIYGAVMTNKIKLEDTCIHYDEALNPSGSSGSIASVTVWQEK